MLRHPAIVAASLLLAILPVAPRDGLCSGPKGSNVYSGSAMVAQPMAEHLCALTFDDGPSNLTPQLLDMLDERGVRATFFMLGRNAVRLPDVVRRVVAEGHEVGIHTWNHPNLKAVSAQRRREEIAGTLDLLRSLGADPVLFRPPYGNRDALVDEIAAGLGLHVVLWSHDSLDWKTRQPDFGLLPDPYGHVARDGDLHGVFLFHDIHRSTIEDLPRIVDELRAAGCQRFVTVSEYMEGVFNDPEPPMCLRRHAPSRSLDPLLAEEARSRAYAAAPGEYPSAATFAERTYVAPSIGDRGVLSPVPAGLSPQRRGRAEAFARARPWAGFARDSVDLRAAIRAELARVTPSPLVVVPTLPGRADPATSPAPVAGAAAGSAPAPGGRQDGVPGTTAFSAVGDTLDRARDWFFGRVSGHAGLR